MRREVAVGAPLGPALALLPLLGVRGHRHRRHQDVSIQTPQFSKNQRSVTWQRTHGDLETEWDGVCRRWAPSPVLLASPGGPVCGSELCVWVPQAGTAKPQPKTGEELAENPLSRRRRHYHGQGREALRTPTLLHPRGPTAFQSPDVSQKRRLRPKGRTGCWVLGLLSSLLAAVTWGQGAGAFPGSGWVPRARGPKCHL